MDPRMIEALAARLGERARVEGSTVHATVHHGDAWLAVRVRTDPVAEVYVGTRPLDGFELRIAIADTDPLTTSFFSIFDITSNDDALMGTWLDAVTQAALLASLETIQTDDVVLLTLVTGLTERSTHKSAWTYELANDQIIATKGAHENDVERFVIAVRTACTLAERSQRWARELVPLATTVGGSAARVVELGGAPVMTATRSAIEVDVAFARRAPFLGERRLRTRITAPRMGEGRLVLARDDISVREGKSFPSELGGYRLRASSQAAAAKIDEMAKKLVPVVQPLLVIVDADSVDVWCEGALVEHARLDAAIALAAHLAVDAIAAYGPYR